WIRLALSIRGNFRANDTTHGITLLGGLRVGYSRPKRYGSWIDGFQRVLGLRAGERNHSSGHGGRPERTWGKESMMPPLALFGISIAFSFTEWGIVLARYVLPELRRQSRADAMQPLILLHCFRFVGLSFLVPGVVSPDLPPAWAVPAAYGDLIAAVLALLALAALKSGLGVVLVWV